MELWLEFLLVILIMLNVFSFMYYLLAYIIDEEKEPIRVWHILVLPAIFLAWLLSRKLGK